jgi:hypothetical protein
MVRLPNLRAMTKTVLVSLVLFRFKANNHIHPEVLNHEIEQRCRLAPLLLRLSVLTSFTDTVGFCGEGLTLRCNSDDCGTDRIPSDCLPKRRPFILVLQGKADSFSSWSREKGSGIR